MIRLQKSQILNGMQRFNPGQENAAAKKAADNALNS
jgi:hypothetical protein